MTCLTDVEVAWLVEGEAMPFDGGDRSGLLDHVASCDVCHALVAESMDSTEEESLRFGRYEMLRVVAGGGMGTVFCAYDPVLRRLVAIKIIADADHDRDVREQMLREARALASVRHENVVAIHDVGIVDDELFLAMEFVEGAPLQLAMHRLADDPARLAILADLTRGVAALHTTGLVHRDLKPSNVMVTPEGRAIVLDLGLAMERDAQHVAAGSRGYVAPEVLDGNAATAASDQYAWWRVASELFAGSALSRRRREGLDRAVARGTSRDPAARFASVDAAFAAVRDIIEPPRARPGMWLGVSLAAVLATSVVVWMGYRPRPDAAAACARIEGWDVAARAQVSAVLLRHGFDDARIVTAIDARRTEIGKLLAQACTAPPSIEHDRQRLCLGVVWRDTIQSVRTIGRDISRARTAEAIDGLVRVLPAARCTDSNPPAPPPVATAAQRADYTSLRDQIDARALHQGKLSIEQLDALRPAIDRNGYFGLRLAWSSAMTSELIFAGDLTRARREIDSARHLAQVTGDDVQLGWFEVTRMRVAIGTQTATDELEADLDAIQARVGSPLLSAEALQARAERAYTSRQPQRAVDLVTTAIELYTKVSLIPAPGLRTAYLMRAASLQQLGKLDQAQEDLERAVDVAKQRYTPDSAELEETAAARANNLMYLGKLDEAATEIRRLREGTTAAHRGRTANAVRMDLSICQIEMVRSTPRTREACEAAVASSESVYGRGSIKTITARNALAQFLVENDPKKAIDVLEESLRIGAKGGSQPLDIPYAEALLALTYHEVKRHAEGCTIATRALAVLRTSPQVDMVTALDAAFPELARGGRCARR